ncbi:hypothetical protein ACWDQL_35965, partial [Streptomyces olivaceus]
MRGGRAAAAVLLLAWALLGLPAPGAAETGAPPREQHRAATTAAPVPAVSAAAVEPAQTPETAQTPVPGETTVPGETAGEPVPCHGGPSRGHVGVRAPRAAGGALIHRRRPFARIARAQAVARLQYCREVAGSPG